MLSRIQNAWGRRTTRGASDDPVAQWATRHFLHHARPAPGQFVISGQLQGKPLRVECGPSSRPYIQGLELRARVDLGLPPNGHVIVLSKAVHRSLETQADEMYLSAVDHLQTSARELPEELRWLTLFRQVRWSEPAPPFWERYAVLSDSVGLARRWLDGEALSYFLAGSAEASAEVSLVVMLMRGRCYLRLQVNPHAKGADALLALELLEHLSNRALMLARRSGAGGQGADEEGLSNPG